MKAYIEKHGLVLLFALFFVAIFIFGGMYSTYMTAQISEHAENNNPVEITHLEYNFDLDTFIASPFIAEITYGDNDDQVVLYIGRSFQVNGIVSGIVPSSDELVAIQLFLTQEVGKYHSTAYFDGYNSSTKTLICKTIGFHGIITVTVEFSSDFTSVANYSVISNETYYEESNYIGEYPPAVENYYMDGFIAGNINLDAVAGTTYGTSPAMQDLVELLDMFQTAQTGGN